MQNSFLVVFKFDPRTAVRDDLGKIFIAIALEKYARRTVKLRYDHALGSVNDERAVLGHQRDLAEENVLLFNIADRRNVGLRVFVINRQANFYLERDAVRHSAFLTFLLIVLVLEADRLTAVVAEIWADGVERAAIVTEHFGRVERIDLDLGRAVLTVRTQMLKTLEITALTLPVADLILDILEHRRLTKI